MNSLFGRLGVWKIFICLLLSLVLVGGGSAALAQPSGPALYLEIQQPYAMQIGSAVNVDVMLNGVTDTLAGIDFEVGYDSSVLELICVNNKKVQPNPDVLDTELFNIEPPTLSSARLAATAKDVNQGYALNGSEVRLATVSFNVIALQDTQLTLINHDLLNLNTDKINVDVYGANLALESTQVPDPPTASPPGGTYSTTQSVVLSAETGAVIYYTTDGSTPTTGSAAFDADAPVIVDCDLTIRAIAVKDGMSSTESSFVYTIMTTPTGGSITGSVSVEGLTDFSGVRVAVWENPQISTTSMSDGSFNLTGVPAGTQKVEFSLRRYLISKITAQVVEGETVSLGHVKLRAGDINSDNTVNIQDLTLLATAYRASSAEPNFNVDADLNNDGQVNIQDLTLLATNYRVDGD